MIRLIHFLLQIFFPFFKVHGFLASIGKSKAYIVKLVNTKNNLSNKLGRKLVNLRAVGRLLYENPLPVLNTNTKQREHKVLAGGKEFCQH